MGHDAIKLELIEWLIRFEDEEVIRNLNIVKDSEHDHDWWIDLTDY